MPPAAVQASFGPTAVTARPDRLSKPGKPPPDQKPSPRRSMRRPLAGIALSVAAALAVGITKGPPQKPEIVSGRAQQKVSRSGAPERWWQGEVTVTLDASLGGVWPDATLGAEHAFVSWLGAPAKLPHLTFDTRPAGPILLEPDGENRVYYGLIPIAGHESDLGITLSYVNPETGEILESDIIINSRQSFAILGSAGESAAEHDGHDANAKGAVSTADGAKRCADKYDVASVLTHEIGHFWGLGEDMVDTSATMYFSTPPCSILKRDLKADDTQAISSLYQAQASASVPSPESAAAGVAHCTVSALGHAPAGRALAPLAALVGLSLLRRRRPATTPR